MAAILRPPKTRGGKDVPTKIILVRAQERKKREVRSRLAGKLPERKETDNETRASIVEGHFNVLVIIKMGVRGAMEAQNKCLKYLKEAQKKNDVLEFEIRNG